MNEKLTPEEKKILFEGGTEAPFSGALLQEHRTGSFVCKNCGTMLFASDTKFESGSGWPSFTEPADREHVTLISDVSHGMTRTEVRCNTCNAHLGHVFDDGPEDKGGMRYCINSLSLEFTPESPETEA
ncbi:MAG: peptide-methionine (R)-S-oxide reductase MsrB [Candidatus Saccharimonadales bacterium]